MPAAAPVVHNWSSRFTTRTAVKVQRRRILHVLVPSREPGRGRRRASTADFSPTACSGRVRRAKINRNIHTIDRRAGGNARPAAAPGILHGSAVKGRWRWRGIVVVSAPRSRADAARRSAGVERVLLMWLLLAGVSGVVVVGVGVVVLGCLEPAASSAAVEYSVRSVWYLQSEIKRGREGGYSISCSDIS